MSKPNPTGPGAVAPRKLPRPNVEFAGAEVAPVSAKQVRGIICNPVYAGLMPFHAPIVSDAEWVFAAERMIREEGAEQFLVNLLFVLRRSLASSAAPDESSGLSPAPAEEARRGQSAPARRRPRSEAVFAGRRTDRPKAGTTPGDRPGVPDGR